jgi:ABC-type Fe3+ transport system substrate-binding protein
MMTIQQRFCRTPRLLAVALVAGVAALVPFSTVNAQSSPSFAQVLDGARKEGALIVWASSPGEQKTYRALFEAFNKRFGLNTKAEFLGINATRGRGRVIAEVAANAVSVDVMGGESADGVMLMARAGVIKPYPWVEVFGKEMPNIAAALYDDVPELRGLSLHYFDAVSGIAWNPNLIKDDDVPSRWTDLADPRWRGKFALNSFIYSPLDQTAYAIGGPAVLDLAKKLMANRPNLENGSPAVARAISAGTSPMGVTSFHAFERASVNKEPMKFKLFADVIPVSPLNLYVIEKAPHVNTGRLFAAWFAAEGVSVAEPFEPLPSTADPNSKLSRLLKAQIAATNAKIAKPSSAQAIDDLVELRKTMQQVLTGQSAN